MPLLSFSSTEANKNLRSDRACRWPDGKINEDRLKGHVSMTLKPKFQFSKVDKIFTIGSCFAREIEKFFDKEGFELPALSVDIPRHERASSTANDILNKYTVHSMENEVKWAFCGNNLQAEDFYIRAENDSWHDSQLVTHIFPTDLNRVIERRTIITNLFKRLPECRIIVITLGLAESWYDTKNDLYLNTMPTATAISQEPDRFRLNLLSYDDILDSLIHIHQLLSDYGHPDFKILITVSPVPFKATFSSKDAILANTYSKSVQRAAAEAFSLLYLNVDYFPSYEIVTLTDRNVAYELDNIHVTRVTVEHIMSTVIKYYVPDLQLNQSQKQDVTIAETRLAPSTRNTLMLKGKEALKSKDYDAAVIFFSACLFRFLEKMSAEEQFEVRLQLGISMLRAKLTKQGVEQLIIAKNLAPSDPRATYKLALGYSRIKMDKEALEMFREAATLDQNKAEYQWRLGSQLIRMGMNSEGIDAIRKALLIDPDHKGSLDILDQYVIRDKY